MFTPDVKCTMHVKYQLIKPDFSYVAKLCWVFKRSETVQWRKLLVFQGRLVYVVSKGKHAERSSFPACTVRFHRLSDAPAPPAPSSLSVTGLLVQDVGLHSMKARTDPIFMSSLEHLPVHT